MCASGRLRLHKFVSNNKNVINYVAESERTLTFQTNDYQLSKHLGSSGTLKMMYFASKLFISYTAQYAFHRGINI